MNDHPFTPSSSLPHAYREHRDRIETLMDDVQENPDTRQALIRDPAAVLAQWGIEFPEDSRPIQVVDLAQANVLTLPPPNDATLTNAEDGTTGNGLRRRWWGMELVLDPDAVQWLGTFGDAGRVISALVKDAGPHRTAAALFGAFLFSQRIEVMRCEQGNGVALRATWVHLSAGLWWLISVGPHNPTIR
ncbi:MAG: hypothetical protein K0U93_01490 [Gammaproteobacteria bacterium]|nr:hypothetical protein [Gammaproteobacteria bacterium]